MNSRIIFLSGKMTWIFKTLLSISLLCLVTAYKTGSPAHVCLSPYPHHKLSEYGEIFPSQPLETSPVTVTMDSNVYGSTKKSIEVSIKTTRDHFKGLIMLVRSKLPITQVPIGEFTHCDSTAIKFLKSESNRTNCLTHKDNKPKPTTIKCTWQPPFLENYGDLELVLSVVKSHSVFWVDLKYPILYDNVKKLPYNYDSFMTPVKKQPRLIPSTAQSIYIDPKGALMLNNHITAFSTSRCGIDRHCLLYPPSCQLTSSCQYMVNIEDLGPKGVAFEVVAPLEGYLGFGISPFNRKAHEALITICRTNAKTKLVSFSTGDTHKHFLFEQLKTWITDRHVGVDPNWMGKVAKVCRYRITEKTLTFKGKPNPLVISLEDDLYYYMASGSLYGVTDYILPHSHNPVKSNGKVNLLKSEYSTHYMSAFILGEKIHATIMILAWVILIPIGTMIPRYLKGVWTTTYVQKVLWLLTHMIAVISGVLVSIISYILLIVINQGWRSVATYHGAFGTMTILTGLVNIAIGFNRPDPKSERRPLFNNVHFFVANLSKFFSYITFWMILLTWGMRTPFMLVSAVINVIWNLTEVIYFGLSFLFRKDKSTLKFFENKQFNPPRVFLISYVVLEALVATSLIATVWLN